MEGKITLAVFFIIFVVIPTAACILVHVINIMGKKILTNNLIGDTVSDIGNITYKVDYETTAKIPGIESVDQFLSAYGGDFYGDYDIRAKDILQKDQDDIPDELPDVDIPLFKPLDQ